MNLLYILNARGDPVPEPDTIRWAEWLEKSWDLRRVGFTKSLAVSITYTSAATLRGKRL